MMAIAAVGVIILAEFQFGDLIRRNPMPQEEPLAQDEPLVQKDLAHLSAKEEAAPTQPLVCKCVSKAWPGGNLTDAHLNMSLPWLKHSTLQELRARHPNLPLELLRGADKNLCSLLPTIFSIEWRNKLWQEAALDATTKFSLYSAVFDPESGVNAPVRVLGVSRNTNPGPGWCHLWFSPEAPPRPVRVASTDYLDWQGRKSGRQMPFLLRCPLPPDTAAVPLAVSLTGKPCEEATNLLRVVGQRQRAYLDSGNKGKPGEPTSQDPHPGYRLRWYFFYNNFEPRKEDKELPEYLFALRHTRREAQHLTRPSAGQFKPVFDMTTVRGVISHGSILCVSGPCPLSEMLRVPTDTAYMGHFRYECEGECVNNTLHDLTLHKYKEEVVYRVGKVLKALHLIR